MDLNCILGGKKFSSWKMVNTPMKEHLHVNHKHSPHIVSEENQELRPGNQLCACEHRIA